MSLAARIQECRHRAGLSQAQVADKLSVSRQAVTKWESGKGTPDIENLRNMARLFGVSVDHLLADGEAGGDVVLRQAIDVSALAPYRPAGTLRGSKTHAAMKQTFPAATVWPLVRLHRNTRTEEATEWWGSLLFDTPFNVFRTTDALSNRAAYYLVEDGTRQLLATVSTDTVEARRLPDPVSGTSFTVGQDRFRRVRRAL